MTTKNYIYDFYILNFAYKKLNAYIILSFL